MKKALIILFLFIAAQIVAFCLGMVLQKLWGLSAGADPVFQGIGLLVCEVLLLVVLTATGLVRSHPFVPLRLRSRWALALVLPGVLLVALGLSLLLEPLMLDDGGQTALFDAMKDEPLCLFLLCVAGPLVEEFVFREGIQRQLTLRGLHPVGAAAVAALVFALVHGNPAQALPAALLGFLLGLLYVRTGDIRLSLPAHMLNNSLAVLFLFCPDLEVSLTPLDLTSQLLLGALLLLAGVGLVVLSWPRLRLAGGSPPPTDRPAAGPHSQTS